LTQSQTWRARRTAFMHRYHARRAARATPATAFLSQPEPRTIGHFARGRQLIAGNYLFAGTLTEGKDTSLWDIDASRIMVRDELHGFGWLDDLAAVGDAKARTCAQKWLNDWIERYGNGTGAGWLPGLTGRRLIRWINHGLFVLRGEDKETSDAFFRSLAQQTLFLSRRWKATPPGLPRFEAITGIIYAGFALEGMRKHVAPAMRALERDCNKAIDEDGGIASRNPEELLDIMTLLNWASMAIAESGEKPPQAVLDAIERIAPTLRALRHADGSLARFHGGGRGLDGRLDHALAASNVRTPPNDGLHMGFGRLNAGRMSHYR